jgi:hypothetical protein
MRTRSPPLPRKVRDYGGTVVMVAKPDGNAERVVNAAVSEFGRLDILDNNAGTKKAERFCR